MTSMVAKVLGFYFFLLHLNMDFHMNQTAYKSVRVMCLCHIAMQVITRFLEDGNKVYVCLAKSIQFC